MSGFKTAQRFESEVAERKLRPAYVLIGDEAFFRKRCREAILKYLAPPEVRDFSLYEMDLLETDITEVLDRARTPSLMAPFQVFFVRGAKALYGRGKHDEGKHHNQRFEHQQHRSGLFGPSTGYSLEDLRSDCCDAHHRSRLRGKAQNRFEKLDLSCKSA